MADKIEFDIEFNRKGAADVEQTKKDLKDLKTRFAQSAVAVGAMGAALVSLALVSLFRPSQENNWRLFKFASAWASLEGSIVLWGLVLAGFTYGVYARFFRNGSRDRLAA